MHKRRCHHCKSVLAFSNPLKKIWRKLRWLIRWSESNNRSPAKSSHYKSDQIMVSITTSSNDITAAELRECRQQREEQREAQQRCAGLAGNDDIRAEVKCMQRIPTGLNSSLLPLRSIPPPTFLRLPGNLQPCAFFSLWLMLASSGATLQWFHTWFMVLK